MEDNDRREENNVTANVNDGSAGRQERHFDNELLPRSSSRKSMRTEQYDKKPTRSRSRSRSKPPRRKQWRSANAFLNFMQDFRQNNSIKSRDLFRLGGQKWRRMSSAEKMPYIEAAKLVQQQSQQNNKNEQQNKPNGSNSTKKSESQKPNQKEKKREKRKRSRSRTDDSDVESDSATSGTVASMTSDDVSDLSS